MGLGVIFSMVLFVLPGLGLGSFGVYMARKKSVTDAGDRVPCPYCKEQILRGATICQFCKSTIPHSP